MIFFDHIYVFVLAVAMPALSYHFYQQKMKTVAEGQPLDRISEYWYTIGLQWFFCLGAFALWSLMGREWSDLGFSLPSGLAFWGGAALVLFAIVFLYKQIQQTREADEETLATLKKSLGSILPFLPHKRKELAVFDGLALTAGIVEEVLWRGYLIWYFSLFCPLWLAALISLLFFTLAHCYQGVENLPRVAAMGAVLTVLFLVTGSLWLPIILHAAVDLLQGRMLFEVVKRTSD